MDVNIARQLLKQPYKFFIGISDSISGLAFIVSLFGFLPILMAVFAPGDEPLTSTAMTGYTIALVLDAALMLFSFVAYIGFALSKAALKKFQLGVNPKYYALRYPGGLKAQKEGILTEGYTLLSQTSEATVLQKKPKFEVWTAIICFILGVLPLVIYIIWFMSQEPQQIVLEAKD